MEMVHDRLVALLWPGTQPIQINEPRDLAKLESAVNSPFQSAFNQDIHPYTLDKGAALFRSLNANHCFFNGNKRTAVMAMDLFFVANGYTLILSNEDMYGLAEKTSTYKIRNVSHEQALSEILDGIKDHLVPFETVEAESKRNPEFVKPYQSLLDMQMRIRSDPRNTLVNRVEPN